ncbi:MAG TPA: imidazole glycerol phosphate synthase subunit HisH [Acidimicrobiia bacterium]|nr:imidazole glycerol phosphate synthase subunit HisH [Acidimicrobiia bacterium]
MIAVVDYGIGNLRSAEKGLVHLGADARLTEDADEIRAADAVVLPGVGAFGACMRALTDARLDAPVLEAAEAGKPLLGICVGMQMLFDGSEESPGVGGLGLIPGMVRRLHDGLVLPHMGWNTVAIRAGSRLFDGIDPPAWLYFVHSYAADPADSAVVAGTTEYGGDVVVAVEAGTIWATQFHPEKSGATGLAVLANFVRAVAPVAA